MEIVYKENSVVLKNAENFKLSETLDCGQAFRFSQNENGVWQGIAFNRCIELYEDNKDIIIGNTNKADFEQIWYNYFDLSRDYKKVIESFKENERLYTAAKFGSGIRILNQEPFEALCSFIISQNNNIPRIKGIVERLCENFGKKTENGYAFPTAEKLSNLSVEDLAVIRSGFRAKYILDAAKKVASGKIDLYSLKNAPYEDAARELMKIKGVGPKVADCTLLYGLSHIEAFPKDVWIKRALNEYFGGEIPECAEKYGGIAQQYIFYYIRNLTP